MHKIIVVYENILEKFVVPHCPIKVKVMVRNFFQLLQYKLSGPITQQARKLILNMYVYHILIYKIYEYCLAPMILQISRVCL